MKRTIAIYALIMSAGAFTLQWLEYQYSVRRFSSEIYIVIIALLCTGLGIWLGHRLTSKPKPPFQKNQQAIKTLGISDREYQILQLLAHGLTNQQIADQLFVSANTVKTHLANLYRKLEASRRTEAVNKARFLRLIA